jgi:hypothetical protein
MEITECVMEIAKCVMEIAKCVMEIAKMRHRRGEADERVSKRHRDVPVDGAVAQVPLEPGQGGLCSQIAHPLR